MKVEVAVLGMTETKIRENGTRTICPIAWKINYYGCCRHYDGGGGGGDDDDDDDYNICYYYRLLLNLLLHRNTVWYGVK